jgi:hypothetical protein
VTTYDENVLQQYADTLYRQAKGIVLWTALKYGFFTFVVAVAGHSRLVTRAKSH